MSSNQLTDFHIAANMYGNAEVGHRACGHSVEVGNLHEAVNFALVHMCSKKESSEED